MITETLQNYTFMILNPKHIFGHSGTKSSRQTRMAS